MTAAAVAANGAPAAARVPVSGRTVARLLSRDPFATQAADI
jgi:hypothetical protein